MQYTYILAIVIWIRWSLIQIWQLANNLILDDHNIMTLVVTETDYYFCFNSANVIKVGNN